jgi:hypothetical protein
MFAVLLAGIMQGEEPTGYVCSIMPQRWLLILLPYVAASYHQKSVRTANINTVQYPKPCKQCEIPTNPAPMISKMLLPQSNIMAAFVHSNSKFLSGSSPGLPTYNNNHGIGLQFTVYSLWSFPVHLLKDLPSTSKYQNTLHFIFLMPTDHIFCILQVLQKKLAYIEAGHLFFFVDVK